MCQGLRPSVEGELASAAFLRVAWSSAGFSLAARARGAAARKEMRTARQHSTARAFTVGLRLVSDLGTGYGRRQEIGNREQGTADSGERIADSRSQIASGLWGAEGAAFDAFFVVRADDEALHVDAGGDDGVGVEGAGLDEFFDFGDGDAGGGGHHGVEIAGGAAVDEVTGAVAF